MASASQWHARRPERLLALASLAVSAGLGAQKRRIITSRVTIAVIVRHACPLLPPRTVFRSVCERRSKALHYHKLCIQSQSSCGTTLLPPRWADERM